MPGPGPPLREKAAMWLFRPETEGDNPDPARPGTGPSTASPSIGISFSWRIERALLNIPGFPSNPCGTKGQTAPQFGAGFGRKALLVLLYLTGRLRGRPSCGSGSKLVSGPVPRLVSGKEKPAGHAFREPGTFPGRDGDRTPSQSLFWALNSAVECHLHTVEVAGSNPAAPTSLRLLRRLRLGMPFERRRLSRRSFSEGGPYRLLRRLRLGLSRRSLGGGGQASQRNSLIRSRIRKRAKAVAP